MPLTIHAPTIRTNHVLADAVVPAAPSENTAIDSFEAQPRSDPDLEISPKQRLALKSDDLGGFWNARIGKDPIARLGVAFWGNPNDLSEAMDRTGLESWKPQLNFFTQLYLQFTAPSHVTIPPETKDELLSYWQYMGTTAETRLKGAIADEISSRGREPTADAINATYREVGLKLAHAHAQAVTQDLQEKVGTTPGLLSSEQVSHYHQTVFASSNLPTSTYGGTPYSAVPDILELGLTSGLYAKDADAWG